MRVSLLVMIALSLASCGVQRPLIKPSEIPAYEKKQQEKRDQIIQEQQELDAIDAQEKADAAAAKDAK